MVGEPAIRGKFDFGPESDSLPTTLTGLAAVLYAPRTQPLCELFVGQRELDTSCCYPAFERIV